MNEGSQAPASPRDAKLRVFVVEDHPLMRRSIVEAIEREPDLMVCGQADEMAAALAAIASSPPDLVLTDLQLRSSSGLDLIKALHDQLPALPIVATTMFDVRRNERQARAAGAAGFCSKQDGPDRLIAAVREVLATAGKRNENP